MARAVNREMFQPSAEGEVRLLLLIDSFSNQADGLQGRTKLAKLDFLLRYPSFFCRALNLRGVDLPDGDEIVESNPIEERMVRYRYGPWDPAYFAILGSLIGRGLVYIVPYNRGLGYKATNKGALLAQAMRSDPAWAKVSGSTKLLRRHFNMSGSTLKRFLYEHFPEVTSAGWTEEL